MIIKDHSVSQKSTGRSEAYIFNMCMGAFEELRRGDKVSQKIVVYYNATLQFSFLRFRHDQPLSLSRVGRRQQKSADIIGLNDARHHLKLC
jgi:hypothetical protein